MRKGWQVWVWSQNGIRTRSFEKEKSARRFARMHDRWAFRVMIVRKGRGDP